LLDRGRFAAVSCDPSESGRFSSTGEVRLLQAHIEGDCRFRGAELRAAPENPGYTFAGDELRCRNLLFEAFTDSPTDSLRFEADGEVRLSNAVVAGRLSIAGAKLHAGPDGDALYADGSTFGWIDGRRQATNLETSGCVSLRNTSIGADVLLDDCRLVAAHSGPCLDVDGARIAGSLVLEGAAIEARTEHDVAVSATSAHVASVLASKKDTPLRVKGVLVLEHATVANVIDLSRGHLNTVTAGGAQIGTLRCTSCRIRGSMSLVDARVTFDCNLSGTTIRAGDGVALLGDGARLMRLRLGIVDSQPFEATGQVSLTAASVEADFVLTGARITAPWPALTMQRFSCPVVTMGTRDSVRTFIDGGLDASTAVISQMLDIRGTSLSTHAGAAARFDGASINQFVARPDSDGRPFTCQGQLSIVGAQLTGGIDLSGCDLDGRDAVSLNLHRSTVAGLVCAPAGSRRARFAGGLGLQRTEVNGITDLRGAFVGTDSDGDGLTADFAEFEEVFAGAAHTPEGTVNFECHGTMRLPRASISGRLDMAGAELYGGARMALFADEVRLTDFRSSGGGSGLHVRGQFRMPGAHVVSDLNLGGVYIEAARDALMISGTSVGLTLTLGGARITAHEGLAIRGSRVQCADLRCDSRGRGPLRTVGGVALEGAVITGQTIFDGARVEATQRLPALRLDDARVGLLSLSGASFSTDGPTAVGARRLDAIRVIVIPDGGRRTDIRGAVRMQGARIEEQLVLVDATVSSDDTGLALSLARSTSPVLSITGCRLGGSLSLLGGTFADRVQLAGVDISGDDDGDAILCDRATFGWLAVGPKSDGTRSEVHGAIRLRSTTVTATLMVAGAIVGSAPDRIAIDATGSAIGDVSLHPSELHGRVVLLGCTARRLVTSSERGPLDGHLDLSGFVYERWDAIDGQQQRRGWQLDVLNRSHRTDSSLEPFERLASVLRTIGDETTARRVLARREALVTEQQHDALRPTNERSWRRIPARLDQAGYRLGRSVYASAVGYGYDATRAFISILLVLAIAVATTQHAAAHDRIVARTPSSQACAVDPGPPTAGARDCGANPASVAVSVPILAAERVIPAVDLGERSRVRVLGWQGSILAVCSVLGWILTIALLAAGAKTLRRD
jgi:hypothetical protein